MSNYLGANAAIGWSQEGTWGVYQTPTMFFRANSESLLPKYDFVEDASLLKENYPTGQWKVGAMVEGALEGAFFPDQAGRQINGVLGGEAAVSNPVVSRVLVSYNGSSAYARLTKATGAITAELSSNGTEWTADTNFNTDGSIEIAGAGFDTVGEIATAINGYTGWDAILLGASTTASAKIADFTAINLKTASVNQGAYVLKAADSTSTTTKTHNVQNAALGTENPSFSFIVDRGLGTNASLTFTGLCAKTLTISNSAKAETKSSLALTGKIEAVDQTDVSLTPAVYVPYLSANVRVIVESSLGVLLELGELKTYNITLDPGLNDNRVLGSLYPIKPVRQQQKLDISLTANNTTEQYPLIAQYKANTPVSMYIHISSDEYADTTNIVPFSIFMRIPTFIFKDFNSPASGKDLLVINASGSAYKSKSTIYPKVVYSEIVDLITTKYDGT